jgi:hypothetical protein
MVCIEILLARGEMKSRIQNPEVRSQNAEAEAALTDSALPLFCSSFLLASGF